MSFVFWTVFFNASKWGFLLGGDFVKKWAKKTGTRGWDILRHNRGESPKYQSYDFFQQTLSNLLFFVGGEAGCGAVTTKGSFG